MIEAYPLSWPDNWKRHSDNMFRDKSRFSTSFTKARDELIHELELMGASHVILSTNIPLRRDGIPYAGMAQPKDPGAAVYFQYKKKSMVFACDRWDKIEANIQALRKTIEAIRGIERWGASSMLERAFTGFTALPSGDEKKPWHVVLGFTGNPLPTLHQVEKQRRILAMRYHPDRGGDARKMAEVNSAYDEAVRQLGG